MGASEANDLEAAERRAREQKRQVEQEKREADTGEAVAAKAASEKASHLVTHFLDRLAKAGWPAGHEIHVLEQGWETVGFLRKRKRPRSTYASYEIWVAPVGVGYRTGLLIGSMLNGGWEYIYSDSQLGIGRDGTLWHGRFHEEKQHRDWGRLAPPSNETKIEALMEALGAILAEYVPVP